MANYYQKEIETMPYAQLRALQNERFLKQVQHVWDNVPYYRQKMEEKMRPLSTRYSMREMTSRNTMSYLT